MSFVNEDPEMSLVWRVAYWLRNSSSDPDHADRATLHMTGQYPQFDFIWPAQRYEMEKLQRALRKAYDAGKGARSREIKALIGAGS